MALSNVMNQMNANAAAPAATAPKTAPTSSKGKDDRVQAFKAHGDAILSKMSDAEKSVLGSKSNTLTFVCCAGDPQRQQSRKSKGKDVPSHKVVGYVFISSEDITVPFAPLKQGANYPTDVEEFTERQVKAGEKFVVNNMEAGRLLSRAEYDGKASGEGGKVVTLTAKANKDSKGVLLPILRTADGSIKENMDLIATEQVGEDGKTKFVLKDFYKESFTNYYTKRMVTRSGAAAQKASQESCSALAAAFREMWGNKETK